MLNPGPYYVCSTTELHSAKINLGEIRPLSEANTEAVVGKSLRLVLKNEEAKPSAARLCQHTWVEALCNRVPD